MIFSRGAAAFTAVCISIGAGGAVAQQALFAEDKAALRVEQQQVFAEMFQKPDDLDLMFRYALVSIQLEDLEAAITTLERMLIYNKDIPRVHMELGAAYYRLGSYKTAKYYFNNVLAFDDIPPEIVSKANEFLRVIEQRTQKSVFVGSVSAGVAFASNATLGPDDPTVTINGIPGFNIGDGVETDDFGIRTSATISHFYDLDQPDSDFWRTDASLFNLHYFSETQNDIDSLQLRTGPQVSLDDKQFGPKLRPFLEVDHVRSGNEALYATFGAGAEYQDTLSDVMSVFGTARIGYRDYFNGRDDFDAVVLRGSGGVAFIPDPNLVLRSALFAERTEADANENAFVELTLRGSATYNYDSDFEFADRLWSLNAFAQATYRKFDDVAAQFAAQTNGSGRRDYDFRAGLRHTFYLTDGFWVAADADFLMRDSNIDLFQIDNFGAALSIGMDF